MKVSILISSYNGKKYLADLLASIRNLELDGHQVEIIIRDDCSNDGTADFLERNHPSVKLLRGESNLGFVGSNNILYKHSTGDILCFVNQDAILEKNFLLEGLAALEKHPDVVGVNTNMLMPWVMSFEDYRNSRRGEFPTYEYQLTRYGYTQYVPVEPVTKETNFMTGGGFFLKRSALSEGEELFDPSIYMYCEDTELCLRLRNRGGVLMYAPKAILYHNHAPIKASSLGELKKLLRITWTRFYVMAKHQGPWSFLMRYPLYVWGIVKKMDYLGLPQKKKPLAFLAGGGLAVVFVLLLPYWIGQCTASSLKSERD